MGTLKRVEYLYETVKSSDGQVMWTVRHWPDIAYRFADPGQGAEDEFEYDGIDGGATWDGEEHDLLSTETTWPETATWGDSRKEEPVEA